MRRREQVSSGISRRLRCRSRAMKSRKGGHQ
jgi:hypothetical protein